MNDEWGTPDLLYDKLHREFNFKYDLCANANNTKCPSWSNDVELFLANYDHEPFKNYWMNPPYSRGNIDKCMKAAYELSLKGNTVVCLVRDDPTTAWYKKYVDGKASEVRRLRNRVKFIGADNCYNFPICVVVYGNRSVTHTENYWSY